MAVKGKGRSETCLFHPDRPAVTRCRACHKPICDECVVSTADGKFCSRECAAKTSDFRKSYKPVKSGPGPIARLVKAVVWVVIILVVLGAANKMVFKNDMPVIGGYLNKLPFLGTGEDQVDLPDLSGALPSKEGEDAASPGEAEAPETETPAK